MRLVFAGTGAFAVPILQALHDAGHRVSMVITQPDRPAGRGLRRRPSPVKETALALGLELFQPERIREADAIDRVRREHAAALIVAAYGQILPGTLLALPDLGAINVHASLLPRHRGPAPIAWAILLGDHETGVTLMQMDAGVDTGPVLTQARLAVGDAETASSLEARLATLGAEVLVHALPEIEAGRLPARPQPDPGVTYARRLTSEDGRLDHPLSARDIDRRVRALTPDPGCWITLPRGRVKILAGHPASDGIAPGGAAIETNEGVYVIDQLQVSGGRPMAAAEWLRGRR